MKHLFVPYELALKLKEKGFNEECLSRFFGDKLTITTTFGCKNSDDVPEQFNFKCTAPLYQQVIDWFREKHNRQIEILWRGDVSAFCYKIGTFRYGSHSFSKKDYDDYYECMTDAIEETLKLI